MPRKNKEEYNEYMRNYMKKKARLQTGKPLMDNDFDAAAAADGKPQFDLNSVNKATGMLKEVFTPADKQGAAEEDPVLKAIEKYSKYIPLVMEFMKGFQTAAKDFQGSSIGQQQNPNIPKAPIGWLEASPMQRLGYKYTRPEWYAAGEAYDAFIESGTMNPAINTGYVDSGYDDAAERRRLAAARQQRAEGEAKSLRELSHKYPEPPLASDSVPMQNEPTQERNQAAVQQADGNKSAARTEAPQQATSEKEEIITELQKDNARYIQLATSYLNSMTIEKFEESIKNIDELVIKAKAFIPLIPIHVKGMIQATPKEDIETIVKDQCPEKYAWLKKHKKVDKLLELFEKVKKEV